MPDEIATGLTPEEFLASKILALLDMEEEGTGFGLEEIRSLCDAAQAAKSMSTKPYRPLTCGTKSTERRGPSDYRVVCATCGAGGGRRHASHAIAVSAAIRDSTHPCRTCGAS